MRGATFGAGVALATALAGPIFAIPMLLATAGPDGSIGGVIIGILFLIFFTMPIGAVLSIVPNMLGSALLGWLGTRYPAARHPLVWLLTGSAMGALIGYASEPSLRYPGPMLGMAGVGATCALLCRWGTLWND